MPKKVISKIDTPPKRGKFPPSPKAIYESFERGFDFGYRKGKLGGSWVLRRFLGREIGYRERKIGRADDDTTRTNALSYDQAREVAREWIKLARASMPVKNEPPLTVARAIEEYVAARNRREAERRVAERGLKRDASSRLKHVDAKLAEIKLADLSTDDLTTWRESLTGMQRDTVRRIANDLRAALNAAVTRHWKKLPTPVRGEIRETIRQGLKTEKAAAPSAREMQILTDHQVRAVVEAAERVDERDGWGGDLAIIVRVMAASGARFSQLTRVRVGDVLFAKRRIMVPVSFKGKGEKQKTHTAVPVAADVMEALAKVTTGRKASELVFLRPDKERISFMKWKVVGRGPWYAAAELNRPWDKIVAEAGLRAGTVAYSLRHSSIVRGLREGLGIEHIAKLHDTSAAMISAHYAADIVDALDEIAARAAFSFAPPPSPPQPVDDTSGKIVKLSAAS